MPTADHAAADLNALPLDELWERFSASPLLRRLFELARDEDLGVLEDPSAPLRDVTCAAINATPVDAAGLGAATMSATLVCREGGVIAGLRAIPLIAEVFGATLTVELHHEDAAQVAPGARVATLSAPPAELLTIERTLLNTVGRLSGIATLTARYADAVRGTKARVLDTRKTTPGMRLLEKYAVRCGGGLNHRLGLADAALFKDNHFAGVALAEFASRVAKASARARANAGPEGLRFVEAEVDSMAQLRAVLAAGGAGADMVLLDNFSIDELRQAVQMRDRAGLTLPLEASGGVTLETIGRIAATGVDRISVGALTHHAVSLDFGLDAAG